MENAGKKEAVCIGRAARALPRCRVLVSEIQPSDRSTEYASTAPNISAIYCTHVLKNVPMYWYLFLGLFLF